MSRSIVGLNFPLATISGREDHFNGATVLQYNLWRRFDLILALALQQHPVVFEVLWLVVACSGARVVTSGDIASRAVGRIPGTMIAVLVRSWNSRSFAPTRPFTHSCVIRAMRLPPLRSSKLPNRASVISLTMTLKIQCQ